MAYATPRTWVAGAVLTAAQLNQDIRDNLLAAFPLGVDAWTAYTPTLTQSGAVTKTVTYARYMKVGRLVTVQLHLVVTGTGTAANAVVVSLPVTAVQGGPVSTGALSIGSGFIWDNSAGLIYGGIVVLPGTTNMALVPASVDVGNYLGAAGGFTAALAVNDAVSMGATYEAAT